MLRLFIYFKGQLLKTRQARDGEVFQKSKIFRNVEFEIISSADYMMTWTSLLPDLPSTKARALVELVGARYPFSPFYHELRDLCPEVAYQDGDEWVFFGGSFNPWHPGHQACLNLIPDEKNVFVIPDRSPHKDLRELDPVTTLLELSVKIRFKKKQYLVPTFLLDHKKNPTVEWIEKLHTEFKNKKLSLLIGFDSFLQIKDWTRAEDLLPKLYKLYVVSRMESALARQAALIPVKKLAPNLEIEFLGHHEHEHVSSTDLRKNTLKI